MILFATILILMQLKSIKVYFIVSIIVHQSMEISVVGAYNLNSLSQIYLVFCFGEWLLLQPTRTLLNGIRKGL